MSPLFIEMVELGQPLDEEEFTDALIRLIETLSLPDKDVLLLRPGKSQKSIQNKQKHKNTENRFHVSILIFILKATKQLKFKANCRITALKH